MTWIDRLFGRLETRDKRFRPNKRADKMKQLNGIRDNLILWNNHNDFSNRLYNEVNGAITVLGKAIERETEKAMNEGPQYGKVPQQ